MWQIQAVEILGLLPYFGSNGVFLLVLQPSAAGFARSFTADRVQTAAGGCRRHLVSSPREIRAETPWPLALLVLLIANSSLLVFQASKLGSRENLFLFSSPNTERKLSQ